MPSGRVEMDGEPDRPFTGWLALLSVLGVAFDQRLDRAARPVAGGVHGAENR